MKRIICILVLLIQVGCSLTVPKEAENSPYGISRQKPPGKDANLGDNNDARENLLHDAVRRGDIETCRTLIAKGMDVNAKNTAGETPLLLAADCGHIGIAKLLLENGADVKIRGDWNSFTPLHWASGVGSKEMVCLLVAHGADVNAQAKDKQTPLHVAVDASRKEIVGWLVDNGAATGAKDKLGYTSLHLAARLGRRKILELLIAKGANVNSLNECENKTPLDSAFDEDIEQVLRRSGAVSARFLWRKKD
jgi:ankyrin repeat protein